MAVLVNRPPQAWPRPPCVLHEDEHLLVVDKPPGLNTHAPSPYAGEGIYEWFRNREPRWANLAVIHRLDKATSGLIVFAKTKLANQSLTQQFMERRVRKRYLLLTSAAPAEKSFLVRSGVVRAGERYVADPHGEPAETKFTYVGEEFGGLHELVAEPVTGRTHQIRVHAELSHIPIAGDTAYGGAPFHRVCLHAFELSFEHPEAGTMVTFESKPRLLMLPHSALRAAVVEPDLTNAFRLIHGAADNHPHLYVDQWGGYQLAQTSRTDLSAVPTPHFLRLSSPNAQNETDFPLYHKVLKKTVSNTAPPDAQPTLVSGSAAPDPFTILENGVRYEISFQQGYSVGLFLDQRDNRRRLLTNYIGSEFQLFEGGLGGREILNTFAYTCAFSVCAALSGARTTSLDLSKKYLDWGKRNFILNNLDPDAHDFIFGDVFDWAPRLAKKSRLFDLILLDPPTFSHSKRGIFQAEKHYVKLVAAALPLLRPNGIVFASCNASKLSPEDFLAQIQSAVASAHRRIVQQHYVPQPPDFPISREEPAYLKTVWLRIA
jgi:23S rRNA (cytosine1962-C5)-methyltransferase